MADKIKQYFQKKKVEAKFKKAGKGHKLTDSPTYQQSVSSTNVTVPRGAPSTEAQQAAAAALARLGGQKHDNVAAFTSLSAIQAQVRRELEAEKKAENKDKTAPEKKPPSGEIEVSPHLAVAGVYFRCPLVGNEILTKDEWNIKIKEFLYDQLEEERGLTSCLIIHTCNKNKEKVELCVETLCKYLENIIQFPTEEKYKKIRMSNRIFQDRVAPVEGARDLLLAAGFQSQQVLLQDVEEEFLVFSEENIENIEYLSSLCDALRSAEPIGLELDRNMQVLLPTQAAQRTELPPAFFTMTAEELKKEQQMRAELIEKSLMLRTKAMREKEEMREMRKYRFSLIRVRFPDGIMLQGTFHVYEKLEAVLKFVSENLIQETTSFVLMTPTGSKLTEEEASHSLLDLRLAPATVLTFLWDAEQSGMTDQKQSYLKPDVMLLVQAL